MTNQKLTKMQNQGEKAIIRVQHGYGKACGFQVMSVMGTGMGTGWAFGNPRHIMPSENPVEAE